MADCYYHGQSSSGNCPECESLKREFPDMSIPDAEKAREKDWKDKSKKKNGEPYRNAWGNVC
jgi:hypothetical protein